MKSLLLLCVICGSIVSAIADVYHYPDENEPALALEKAVEISRKIISKLEPDDAYHPVEVSLSGDKNQTGGGAWNLVFKGRKGGRFNVAVLFPKKICVVYGGRREADKKEIVLSWEGVIIPDGNTKNK